MPPTFAQLGVPESICRALSRRGIDAPFEIQAVTIADALAGKDICGRAPTGSGKTLAFGIPLIATAKRAESGRPRSLVLSPTRELADQIADELRTFAGDIRIGVVYGGVGYGAQVKRLRQGVDILVACPGRLEDLIEQRVVSLGAVDHVVLDEADRMADMGFMPAVKRLLDATASKRQTILFSATLDGDVAKLTRDYQNNPVRHEVGEETPDIRAAQHRFWKVDKASRADVAAQVIATSWPSVVFCRTRHGADRLAKQLEQRGVSAAAIHGGHNQNRRTRSLAQFSKNQVQALVATDVAARGIHVDGVASVVHFDPPEDSKAYVHRSGRTARAGESGLVVSLLQGDQLKDTRRLQRDLGLDEPITEPQIDPDATPRPPKPRPIENDERPNRSDGRGDGGGRNGGPRRRNQSNRGRQAGKASRKPRVKQGSRQEASSGEGRRSGASGGEGGKSRRRNPARSTSGR